MAEERGMKRDLVHHRSMWAAWAAIVAGLAGCYNANGGEIEAQGLAPGETSLGIYAQAHLKDRLDYNSYYMLSLANDDPLQGCNVALYFFDDEPRQSDVPVLTTGEVAPATLPGGGWLHYEWYLPPATPGERTFSVSLSWQKLYPERDTDLLTELHRGLVLATSGCPGLSLELTLYVEAWGLVGRPSDREVRGYLRRLW